MIPSTPTTHTIMQRCRTISCPRTCKHGLDIAPSQSLINLLWLMLIQIANFITTGIASTVAPIHTTVVHTPMSSDHANESSNHAPSSQSNSDDVADSQPHSDDVVDSQPSTDDVAFFDTGQFLPSNHQAKN